MAESGILTEQESALYDRQIRVWGADAQKRMGKARLLVAGLSGATIEACKNVVLAGIGSVTLLDDRLISEEHIASIFLIPAEAQVAVPAPKLSEICAEALRDFNPMVTIHVAEGQVEEKGDEFYDDFDAVLLGRAPLITRKKVNRMCRNRPSPVCYFEADLRGGLGRTFSDLGEHHYKVKGKESEPAVVERFASLEDVLGVPWKSHPKKTPHAFYAFRVMEEFEASSNSVPGQVGTNQIQELKEVRDTMAKAQGVEANVISDTLLERMASARSTEMPAMTPIIGGLLGQEILRCVSQKGKPANNFMVLDSNAPEARIAYIAPTS